MQQAAQTCSAQPQTDVPQYTQDAYEYFDDPPAAGTWPLFCAVSVPLLCIALFIPLLFLIDASIKPPAALLRPLLIEIAVPVYLCAWLISITWHLKNIVRLKKYALEAVRDFLSIASYFTGLATMMLAIILLVKAPHIEFVDLIALLSVTAGFVCNLVWYKHFIQSTLLIKTWARIHGLDSVSFALADNSAQ